LEIVNTPTKIKDFKQVLVESKDVKTQTDNFQLSSGLDKMDNNP